jgi:hypothetical protein
MLCKKKTWGIWFEGLDSEWTIPSYLWNYPICWLEKWNIMVFEGSTHDRLPHYRARWYLRPNSPLIVQQNKTWYQLIKNVEQDPVLSFTMMNQELFRNAMWKISMRWQNKENGQRQTFIDVLTTSTPTSCKANSNMICRHKMGKLEQLGSSIGHIIIMNQNISLLYSM